MSGCDRLRRGVVLSTTGQA